ncbi:MAG: hypothetical protein AAF357_15545 [Verrucomicrobiota bacterium]
MSFTLRNLFSEEDGEPGAEWSEGDDGVRENAPPGGKAEAPPKGQPYLVRELLPFIPPAIAASGSLPMEKEVHIPLGDGGSTDVSLAAIYQQCPELFDAEITPLNDSTVTLPAKSGKLKEAAKAGESIFDAAVTPFGAPGFGMPDSEEETAVDEAEDNPFWSPEPERETVVEKVEEQAPAMGSGFPSGFSDSLPAEVSQKKEEGGFGEMPSSKDKPEMPLAEAASGFGAPPKPKAENSFSDDTGAPAADSEKASGFSENPFDSSESFSTLFSTKAEEDADIPFPGSGGDESSWGAMFDTESENDTSETTSDSAGVGEVLEKNDISNRDKAVSTASPGPTPVAEDEPEVEEAPPEPSVIKEAPAKATATSFPVEKPVADKTPVPPAEERVDESAMKVEEEHLAPSASVPAMPGEMEVSFKDLEFRAIFSSDDSFTLAKVARKVVAFEGVCACALATPAKLVQASRNEQSRLGDEAREMVDAIRNLAKLTGLPEARAFTLQTDRGTVSLFLEGDCCVTVNHLSSGFGPGVREKLILVARNIHKLQE